MSGLTGARTPVGVAARDMMGRMPVPSSVISDALRYASPTVFWTDRPERPQDRPTLVGTDHRADLVIVGGGFTGLWAAIQAKEDNPGREVVVLEKEWIGFGASGRNGAFAAPSLTHGLAQALSRCPHKWPLRDSLPE